jgi:two-component system sensor histidine kinase KdpD
MLSPIDSEARWTMAGKRHHEVAARLFLGVAAALLITGAAYKLRFNLSSATSLHLLLVTVIALRWGFLEASVVSLLSVGCLDYFFTEPLFQLYITDSHDWVALITFQSVALVVSRLSNRVSRHVRDSELHNANLQKLYELSQGVLLLDGHEAIEQQLATLIHTALDAEGVALWNGYNQHLSVRGACEATEDDMRSICQGERNDDDPSTNPARRVLQSGTRAIGSLLLSGHSLNVASINAAASLIAVAIERARSFTAESNAEAGRQSEQLRSAILDGLAHAFKTPLTTIKSCSSGLIEIGNLGGREKRLVVLIDTEVSRLDDLTTRVLKTAKVDTLTLRPRRDRLQVAGLLQESVAESVQQLGDHPVVIQPYAQQKTIWADKQLLKMALSQLFDNAAKYSSPGTAITIDVLEEEAETLISVRNEGSFIPQEERDKIFKRFYRSPGSNLRAPGTGIGLSVVKQVIESHQGRVWVSSNLQTGTTFFLSLPRSVNQE